MGNVNVNGGPLEFSAFINASQFNAAISSLEKQLEGLTRTTKEQSNEMESFARKASIAIGSYLTFTTATNFIGDLVKVRGEFQQLEVAFTTMLRSKEKADKLMAEITQLAATTPFSLQDVASGAKQLLAYGFAAENVVGTIRMLGNVASGVGAPLSDIVYLYGTLQTQGRAYTKDIMQFTARGIPIIDQLAKQFGVTKDQVQGLVEAGKVGFPEVEKAFQAMTGQGGIFFNLMEEQSKTLTGQISNLGDAWDRMLNDIGKSGEGVFADAIQAATFLVEHYQDVLDILKVLVITYGTYKAAVIANTAVQAVATAATKGYTIAETLRYRAMLLSETAMKLLNKTMLANPYVAVATGIATLIGSLAVFGKTATAAKSKADLLAEAEDKIGDRMAETESKIRPLIDALKKANISEQEKLEIYNKLKAIDPEIVRGIDAKTISYEALTKNVNSYLDSLRSQFALEANKEALTGSIREERSIQKRIDLLKKRKQAQDEEIKSARDAESRGLAQFESQRLATEIQVEKDRLENQKKVSEELGQTQVESEKKTQNEKKRTLKVIDDEISEERKRQQELSTNSKEYREHQKKINALEEERKRIVGASKKEISDANSLESQTNSILEERKGILQTIADLQRDARQSGLSKEQSELDRVNEKYDTAIRKIAEFNSKVDEFNKKNKTNVQQIGQTDVQALNEARQRELDNTRLKQDADRFKQNLETQKAIFEQYEEAKKNIGVEKANELFKEQTKGYTSYLDFLKSEAEKIAPKIVFGIANVGDIEKMKSVTKAVNDEEKRNEAEIFKQRIDDIQRLFAETATFNQRRLAIDRQYEKDLAVLRNEFSGAELDQQIENLNIIHKKEIKNLQDSVTRSGELYRKLGEDVINFNKQQLKQRIAELKETLETNTSLTPQMRADIMSTISNLEGLMNATDETINHIDEFIEKGSEIKTAFDGLSAAVAPLNGELSDALNLMSGLLTSSLQVGQALKDFKVSKNNGDIVGQITSITGIVSAVMTAITLIVNLIKNAKNKLKDAANEIKEFYSQMITGEMEYQELLRERARQTILNNKLTLQGLADQKKLLDEQKKANQQEFDDILAKLQKETFVVGKTVNKNVFDLLFGKDKAAKDVVASLAGKSFDQLEELFNKGQLTGKAKELFEQLQKIKQEGADIDALLEENRQRAAEIFTGTTADSIVDTIADGFKNGLHSAADFASTFEDLMRQAMINSLKFQYLEGPLKDFFEEFAKSSESDNTLTQSEIDNLKNLFNSIISNADQKFQELQQIAGIDFGTAGSSTNSLVGAIKGMSEQTAELLAGQLGGMRLVGIDQLNLMKTALQVQQNIENNTAQTAVRMQRLLDKFDAYETGAKKISIN